MNKLLLASVAVLLMVSDTKKLERKFRSYQCARFF
jgi:hypothetical protein